jgi:hypothetical protein
MGALGAFLVVSSLLFVFHDAAVTVARSADVVKNVAGKIHSKTHKTLDLSSPRLKGSHLKNDRTKESLTKITPSGRPVNKPAVKPAINKPPLIEIPDPKVSMHLALMLSPVGYLSRCSESGVALQKICEGRLDVCLNDAMLPADDSFCLVETKGVLLDHHLLRRRVQQKIGRSLR